MTDLMKRGAMGQKPPKTKPNPKHLERVKSLRCVICHAPPPSDAHHCISGRFSRSRAPDEMTIPLCKICHQWGPDAIHNNKRAWEARNGPDTDYLDVTADMLAGDLTL